MRSRSGISPTGCAAARRSSQPWPRDERVLSLSERLELQQHLARRGFDVGEPDGHLGAKTRVAVRNYQASAGLVPDGFASSSVLIHLRGQ